MRRGKPLYWFIDWKDHWSVIYCSIIGVVFATFFYFSAILDEKITGRSSLKKNDNMVEKKNE